MKFTKMGLEKSVKDEHGTENCLEELREFQL